MAATDTMAPLIQGLTWAITIVSLLVVSVRVYIKWKYLGKLRYDDYILMASMVSITLSLVGMFVPNVLSKVFLLANASISQRTVALGYGQHIDEIATEMPRKIREILMYLQVLSGVVLISTTLARISFAATLLQLSNQKEKRFVWFAITTLPAVAIPAIVFPFISCIPYDKIFDDSIPGKCMDEGVGIGYFIFEAGS